MINTPGYIKQDVINKLISNQGDINYVSEMLSKLKHVEPLALYKSVNPYVFVNRSEEVQAIVQFLNEDKQKLLLVGGIQGSGKSVIVRSTLIASKEHVLVYWYECSKITNLDDLLLSLCAFFDKKVGKSKILPKERQNISIDESLITYLKNLNRPLIIVLDSIEFLVSPSFTVEDEELKHFFNYLLSHPLIKLILIGQRLPKSDMDYIEDFITEIRVPGLAEENAKTLLRNSGLSGSNSLLAEIYKFSRGYPWILLLASKISTKLDVSVNKLIKDMSNYEDSFESYLVKMIYQELPKNESTLLNYLCAFSHPINIPTIMKICKISEDPHNILDKLSELMLIQNTGNRYYVNTIVRKYVYSLIPVDLKYELHNIISNFYADEISKKLADRTIRLSRKLLHSEQYFHNMSATKLYDEKGKLDKKPQLTLDYQPSNIRDPYHYAEIPEPNPKLMQQIEEINSKKLNSSQEEILSDNNVLSNKYTHKEILNINGFEIELTDEEKALLGQEKEEPTIPPSTKQQSIDIMPIQMNEFDGEYSTDDVETVFDLDTKEMIGIDPESTTANLDILESFIFVAQGYALENKHDTAIERFKEALELAEKLDYPEAVAKALMPMAKSYMVLKQYKLAIECYERCKAICEEIGCLTEIPAIVTDMARVYYECYQHEKALQLYNEVLKMPPGYLSNQVKASTYMGIGEVYDYRQQLKEALNYYFQALNALKEINDSLDQAIVYSRIGLIYDDMGEYQKAIDNYELSLKLDMQLGRKNSYASTLSNLAAVCEELGQKSRALNYYKQSLIIDKELQNFEGLYKTLSRIGTIYTEMDDTDKALKYYQQELKVAKNVKDPYWIAMAYLDLGDLYYYTQDFSKAAKYFFIAQNVISKSISTDSREKIERRIRKLQAYISKEQLESIKSQIISKQNE